jgi:HK97 family phage major capsid protein
MDQQGIREQLASLHARTVAIMDTAKEENRDLSAEECRRMDGLLEKIDELKGRIDDGYADRVQALTAELARPQGRVTPVEPIENRGRITADANPLSRAFGAPGRAKWTDVFGKAGGDNGFVSFADFASAVAYNDTARLMPRNAAGGMTEGTGADGGFAVPVQYAREIMDAALEMEVVRPRARVFPMTSSSLVLPAWDASNHSTGIAGFVGTWMAEAGTATVQKGKLRNLEFNAKKLGIWTAVTRELAQDGGPAFGSFLSEALAKAIANYFDRAFVRGTGAGQPLGLIAAPSTVSVAKEGSQVAATIVAENVHKMLARLAPSSFGNSVWIAHPSTLPQLLQLTIKVQNVAGSENVGGYGSQALTQAANGTFSILTRPVIFSEHASALGTVGDLILVDLSQYGVAMRQDLRIEKDLGSYWTSDEIGFRAVARLDGMPLWSSAVTPVNGSDTLSWCVTLATRS